MDMSLTLLALILGVVSTVSYYRIAQLQKELELQKKINDYTERHLAEMEIKITKLEAKTQDEARFTAIEQKVAVLQMKGAR